MRSLGSPARASYVPVGWAPTCRQGLQGSGSGLRPAQDLLAALLFLRTRACVRACACMPVCAHVHAYLCVCMHTCAWPVQHWS